MNRRSFLATLLGAAAAIYQPRLAKLPTLCGAEVKLEEPLTATDVFRRREELELAAGSMLERLHNELLLSLLGCEFTGLCHRYGTSPGEDDILSPHRVFARRGPLSLPAGNLDQR